MSNIEPKGAVHWIDHYVVGTNDLPRWSCWALHATGLPIQPINGLTTSMRKKNTPIFCFMWWEGGSCRIGAFLQPENYPPAKPLGEDMPRCGFYIRPEDIDHPDFIPAGHNSVMVTSKVDVTELMGNEIFLHLVSGKNTFVARVDPRSSLRVGNQSHVMFDMDSFHIFDATTEQAIR